MSVIEFFLPFQPAEMSTYWAMSRGVKARTPLEAADESTLLPRITMCTPSIVGSSMARKTSPGSSKPHICTSAKARTAEAM